MIDVDKSYDPDGGLTLDQHRQAEFAKVTQPGFGAKASPPPEPAQPAASDAADDHD